MICEDPEDTLVFGFSLVVPLGDKRKRSRDNDSEPAQRKSGHGKKSHSHSDARPSDSPPARDAMRPISSPAYFL
jgi:hypothetical protein